MNYENKFKEWLESKEVSPSALSNYKIALREHIPNKLKKIEENDYNNLFECDDLEYLQSLKKRLLKEGNLHEYNQNKNNFPSASIGNYIEFLEHQNIPSIKKYKNSKTHTKNIILYGPPGVGKTYNHKKLISLIASGENQKDIFDAIRNNDLDYDDSLFETVKEEDHFKFVTFHQSYSYEDFIEGFRPNEDGSIKLEDGIFKEIAEEAQTQPQKNFYLLIDEINRGNISKIFGELITLIEDDKRDEIEVTLPYSKESFKVPSNLYIIATMNSTDKSIALIDVALRRRFTFLKMEPDASLVDSKALDIFTKLNELIKSKLGEDYLIGHSYFMDCDLDFVLEYKIKPLLEEYFYSDNEGLKEALEIISYRG